MVSYICSLSGELHVLDKMHVQITTHGVGYRLRCSQAFIQNYEEFDPTTIVFLYVAHVISETSQTLYGFETEREQLLFSELLKVKRMGPVTIMALLDTQTPDDIVLAAVSGNEALFKGVPGIGPTRASTMIEAIQKLEWIKKEQAFLQDIQRLQDIGLIELGFSLEELKQIGRQIHVADYENDDELLLAVLDKK